MSSDGLGNVIMGVEYTGNLDLGSSVGLIESSDSYGASAVIKVSGAGNPEFFFSGIVVGDIDFGTATLVAKSYVQDMFVVKLGP